MSEISIVELFAGTQADGSPVVERVPAIEQEDSSLVLVRSPGFIKGIAKGDQIKINKEDHSFEIVKRSGNLCIRIFAKQNLEKIIEDIAPLIEKMGGELDHENERMSVFSIHVSCGFTDIEKILNDHIGDETDSAWFYGNVYDPRDGVTPLNWWKDILKPQ